MMSAAALAIVMMMTTLAVTVSAATLMTAIMMMMSALAMSMAAATFVVAIMMMVMMTTTSAALITHAIEHAFDFFIGSFAALYYRTFEIELCSGKGMIEIDDHFVIGDIEHQTDETIAILVLQRHNGILIDILMVEMTVYREDAFIQTEHPVVLVLAIGLVASEVKIKLSTLLDVVHLILKLVERDAKTGDKLERFVCGGLLDHLGITVRNSIQLVCNRYVLILFLIHNSDLMVCFILLKVSVYVGKDSKLN